MKKASVDATVDQWVREEEALFVQSRLESSQLLHPLLIRKTEKHDGMTVKTFVRLSWQSKTDDGMTDKTDEGRRGNVVFTSLRSHFRLLNSIIRMGFEIPYTLWG